MIRSTLLVVMLTIWSIGCAGGVGPNYQTEPWISSSCVLDDGADVFCDSEIIRLEDK